MENTPASKPPIRGKQWLVAIHAFPRPEYAGSILAARNFDHKSG